MVRGLYFPNMLMALFFCSRIVQLFYAKESGSVWLMSRKRCTYCFVYDVEQVALVV